jgi:exoribonuclease-2
MPEKSVVEQDDFRSGSLALYKKRPARVVHTGERIEIALENGDLARVRPKDLVLLHPGPVGSLAELRPMEGEVELAWQMLSESGEALSLGELAELIYGEYTPASAWATWQLVEDSLYFYGAPGQVMARLAEQVAQEQGQRQARAAEAQAWANFVQRARIGRIHPQEDGRFLREVEDLALGRRKDSRLLRELGRSERPENAHALLLGCGAWDHFVDPYPARLGLPITAPPGELPSIPNEPRLDLTDLPAFAIDDRNNKDPDDAISLVSCEIDERGNFLGGHLWVHIADVAALVAPDSEADLEARGRGATLYLPEGAVPMLPLAAIQTLGLGLQPVSPSLSFNLGLNAAGEIVSVDVQPSWVRVQRLAYEVAEERLEDEPLRSLYLMTQAYSARRQTGGALSGATSIDLPEVMVRVEDRRVSIEPVLRLRSRALVREAMIMSGEAGARFAIQRGLSFPFAVQEPPSPPAYSGGLAIPNVSSGEMTMAERFAMRRWLRRSQVSSLPAPHAGVGLPAYSRVTSPLRRYLDLVAHQQLRACLGRGELLNVSAMVERIGNAEAITGTVNMTEALARRHWTLVYLIQHPGWQGEGVLVEKNGLQGTVILPELALETPVHLREDLPLDSHMALTLRDVNLPELEVSFAVG